MNLQESIRRILREETEYVKDVRVKISDILKTNRDGQSLDDAIVNVQDGLKSYSEGLPFLLKIGDKYEVLDGFHRIAQKILDGKKYIISDVMIKESNMNLQESIRRILREEKKEIFTNLLIKYINSVSANNEMYCGVEVIPPSENNNSPYRIILYLIGGPNSNSWPRTQAVVDKEIKLIVNINESLKNLFPFKYEYNVVYFESCDKL